MEVTIDDLLRKIGALTMENDWLRQQLSQLLAERDALVAERDARPSADAP